QKLEEHDGLVILASNLKDNIDSAFARRLQIVVHFPRPDLPQRCLLWRLALPPTAPVDPAVDFDVLARLDLTGAGIVDSARVAALLAADESSPTITSRHLVRAVARQFQREARLLTASDLGVYGHLLSERR